ncbi:MAG: hypothetical protein J5892_02575 [Bacilli bacterium]|nr:hypothetical protein [Bacilli bacterium]
MRESIGGTWTMQIVIVFILFFVAFITLTINYTRAFKVKNEIISIIEREDGFTWSAPDNIDDPAGARELIAAYLRNNKYSATGRCDEGWVGVKSIAQNDVSDNSTYVSIDEDTKSQKYYYCIKKINVPIKGRADYEAYNYKNRAYYKVRMFFKFSIPIFGDLTTFKVEGESLEVYFNQDGLKLNPDEDFKAPAAQVTTCTSGYTLVKGACKDVTAPTVPTLELFNPIVSSSTASYCLRMSDSVDEADGKTVSQVTYEVKINNYWKICSGESNCCFNLENANTNYQITGRACDTSNNCSFAKRTIQMNPKRLYIWQVYQYLRSNNGSSIIGQPSEDEISSNLASNKMADNVKGMYSSKESYDYFGPMGAEDVLIHYYRGILGRNYDDAGMADNMRAYNIEGRINMIKTFVNSKEAQDYIYAKWGLGTGTV